VKLWILVIWFGLFVEKCVLNFTKSEQRGTHMNNVSVILIMIHWCIVMYMRVASLTRTDARLSRSAVIYLFFISWILDASSLNAH
jgi:hypothetical protein